MVALDGADGVVGGALAPSKANPSADELSRAADARFLGARGTDGLSTRGCCLAPSKTTPDEFPRLVDGRFLGSGVPNLLRTTSRSLSGTAAHLCGLLIRGSARSATTLRSGFIGSGGADGLSTRGCSLALSKTNPDEFPVDDGFRSVGANAPWRCGCFLVGATADALVGGRAFEDNGLFFSSF